MVKAVSKFGSKVTLSMIIHNEADRYLRQALTAHREYIDEAVIIDDGSTDDSADICREVLQGIPLHLVRNPQSSFHNEVQLRKQQWHETVSMNPDWILNLDADEWFEPQAQSMLAEITGQADYHTIYLRLYDMWNETHYRDDKYWSAHTVYRPFLFRYVPGIEYRWKEVPQHCGRFPLDVLEYSYWCHPLRVKHYGWSRLEDRKAKYDRYMRLDSSMQFGWREQYESILDDAPPLVKWED